MPARCRFPASAATGRATPFAITFDLPDAPRGKATLRLAICGTGARAIEVTVNDQPAGQVDRLIGDGAIARHSIQGLWYERELAFDASLLKQGTNVLKLIVPAGPINNGMIYDYLRLELDEAGWIAVRSDRDGLRLKPDRQLPRTMPGNAARRNRGRPSSPPGPRCGRCCGSGRRGRRW